MHSKQVLAAVQKAAAAAGRGGGAAAASSPASAARDAARRTAGRHAGSLARNDAQEVLRTLNRMGCRGEPCQVAVFHRLAYLAERDPGPARVAELTHLAADGKLRSAECVGRFRTVCTRSVAAGFAPKHAARALSSLSKLSAVPGLDPAVVADAVAAAVKPGGGASAADLVDVLWCCVREGVPDGGVAAELAARLEAGGSGWDAKTLALCSWSFGRLRVADGSAPAVARRVAALAEAGSLGGLDASHLLHYFATAAHADAAVAAALTRVLLRPPAPLSSQMVSSSMWALASLRLGGPSVVATLGATGAQMGSRADLVGTVNMVWALLTSGVTIGKQHAPLVQRLSSEVRGLKGKEMASLLSSAASSPADIAAAVPAVRGLCLEIANRLAAEGRRCLTDVGTPYLAQMPSHLVRLGIPSRGALHAVGKEVLRREASVGSREAAGVLWAFAKAQCREDELDLFAVLGKAIVRQVGLQGRASVAQPDALTLLWSFATLRIRHAAVRGLFERTAEDVGELASAADAARFAWAAAHLGLLGGGGGGGVADSVARRLSALSPEPRHVAAAASAAAVARAPEAAATLAGAARALAADAPHAWAAAPEAAAVAVAAIVAAAPESEAAAGVVEEVVPLLEAQSLERLSLERVLWACGAARRCPERVRRALVRRARYLAGGGDGGFADEAAKARVAASLQQLGLSLEG